MFVQRVSIEFTRIWQGKGNLIFFLGLFLAGFLTFQGGVISGRSQVGEWLVSAPLQGERLGVASVTTGPSIAGVYFILGSLYMLFMGVTAYASERHFFHFGNICLRLGILWAFFLVAHLGYMYISGIAGEVPPGTAPGILIPKCLYLLAFFSFFYAVGVLIRVWVDQGSDKFFYPLLFWVAIVFVLPWVVALYFSGQGLSTTLPYQWLQPFYPGGFYFFSGEFLVGAMSIPLGLTSGTVLMGGYCSLLLGLSYFLVIRRRTTPPSISPPAYPYLSGHSYHVLCKDENHRDQMARYYQQQPNAVIVEKITPEEIDLGVGLVPTIEYFLNDLKADDSQFENNLLVLGLSIKNLQDQPHRAKKEREEILLKIYAAVLLACQQNLIIVNDFLKGKSRSMEKSFLKLVNLLNRKGKTVVFISCDLYKTALPFEGEIQNHHFLCFRVDPRGVSLR